jgi:hypothetical protein
MLRPNLKHAAIAVPLALVSIAALGARATPDRIKISGTATLAFTNRQMAAVGDVEGHALILAEARGANRNTGPTEYMSGAEVTNVELADLVRGTGPHHGYITFAKDGESAMAKWVGQVNTTLSSADAPVTTFQGTWSIVKGTGQYEGISGSGTYNGRFTSQAAYAVDWKGEYSR